LPNAYKQDFLLSFCGLDNLGHAQFQQTLKSRSNKGDKMFIEIVFIAVALSMDAFAAAVCKGLSLEKAKPAHAFIVGLWFGFFQAAMPIAGFFLGAAFAGKIKAFDHWVAFVLLCAIGIQMLRESFSKEEKKEQKNNAGVSARVMLPLAIATSIDALAVGVTFSFLNKPIFESAAAIGVITFGLSALGVQMGLKIGQKNRARAQFAGGAVLICIGAKILIEHIFF
jgi:putative Mn2+ efflux pump MntP